MAEFSGRCIFSGKAHGELLFSSASISFYGGVDANTGIVVEKGHPLQGKCIAGKVLAFPHGKGSTIGSYVLYRLKKNGKASLALINEKAEAIIAVGAIISEIPMIDKVDFGKLKGWDGKKVRVDGDAGIIRLVDGAGKVKMDAKMGGIRLIQ